MRKALETGQYSGSRHRGQGRFVRYGRSRSGGRVLDCGSGEMHGYRVDPSPACTTPPSKPIRDKVLAGRRLSFEDGVALYRDPRPPGARPARQPRPRGEARRRRLLRVEHPHQPHERLRGHVRLLRLRREEGRARAYTMKLDEVFGERVPAAEAGPRGPHRRRAAPRPALGRTSRTCCRGIKQVRPDVHVKAFTAVEIFFFHRLYRMSVEQVLAELKEAGLDSMPGGGAEIFAKETRNRIIKGKADAAQWLDVMRTAHRLGIPVERDHALRPRRVARGPGGPPAAAARAAGRDRRLRDLHPARLPALGSAGHEAARDHRLRRPEGDRGGAA